MVYAKAVPTCTLAVVKVTVTVLPSSTVAADRVST